MEPNQSSNQQGSGGMNERPAQGTMRTGKGGDENMDIKAQREDVNSIEQLNEANMQYERERQPASFQDPQARRVVAESEPMDIMVQREDIDSGLRDRTDIPRQARTQQQSMGRQATAGGPSGKDEMSNFRADLDEFISRIPGMSGMDLNAAKDKLLSSLASSRESAMGYASDAREQINRKVEATGEYVKEKPMQSVGIAAGVGFLIGLLVSRR